MSNENLIERLYFAATSGVCLIRSGTVGFQKKLQSQKKIPPLSPAGATSVDAKRWSLEDQLEGLAALEIFFSSD